MSLSYQISRFEYNEILSKNIIFYDVSLPNGYKRQFTVSADPIPDKTNEEQAQLAYESISDSVLDFYNDNINKTSLNENTYIIDVSHPAESHSLFSAETVPIIFNYGANIETEPLNCIFSRIATSGSGGIVYIKLLSCEIIVNESAKFISMDPLPEHLRPSSEIIGPIIIKDNIDSFELVTYGMFKITSSGYIEISSVKYSLIPYNGLSDQDFHALGANFASNSQDKAIGWPMQTINYSL